MGIPNPKKKLERAVAVFLSGAIARVTGGWLMRTGQ